MTANLPKIYKKKDEIMAQNDYQTFGDSGTDGVNKLSLANYTTDNDRVFGNGYTTKVIRSQLVNKALQQTSKISAAVAQFLVNNGLNALDTDNVATVAGNINNAVESLASGTLAADENGYQKLPSGLIMQWGKSASISSESGQTITFPVAFPNAFFNASATVLISSAENSNDYWGQIYSPTATNMGVYLQVAPFATTSYPVYIFWFAIGN
jgi:ribosomal protein S8E